MPMDDDRAGAAEPPDAVASGSARDRCGATGSAFGRRRIPVRRHRHALQTGDIFSLLQTQVAYFTAATGTNELMERR